MRENLIWLKFDYKAVCWGGEELEIEAEFGFRSKVLLFAKSSGFWIEVQPQQRNQADDQRKIISFSLGPWAHDILPGDFLDLENIQHMNIF